MSDKFLMLTLILASAVCSAIFFVLTARILRFKESADSSLAVIGITHLAAGFLALPFLFFWNPMKGGMPANLGTFGFLLALAVLLHLLAKFFHFRALSLTDVALVSPYGALTPVFTVILGAVLLSEKPAPLALAGIGVVTFAILGLHTNLAWKKLRELVRMPLGKELWRNGSFFALLSSVPPALKLITQKQALTLSDPVFYSVLILFFTGAAALILTLMKDGKHGVKELGRLMFPLSAVSVFLMFNTIFFSAALTFDLAANVSAIARITIVLQVLLASFLAGQKKDLGPRLFWSALVLAGAVLITLA